MPSESNPSAIQIGGTVERITYHDPESGFCVLRVRADDGPEAALTPVVGRLTAISVGETVEATGRWVIDARHGPQFKADSLRTTVPTTTEGLRKYLGSGVVRGIGPKIAEKIVSLYGEKTLDILDNYPEMLASVPGIGRARIAGIKASWREQRTVREIMIFLHGHGIGAARAVRIHRVYGDQAVGVIRANPYRLAEEIHGIGFQTADELAMELGLDRESPDRLRAGIVFAMNRAADSGHCGLPSERLIEAATELLASDLGPVEDRVNDLVSAGKLVRETVRGETWCFLPDLHAAELGVTEAIHRLSDANGASTWHPLGQTDWDAIAGEIERQFGILLGEQQRNAVQAATRERLLIITGGPGVGKTTIVRTVLEIYERAGLVCHLAAPTGRAAKRLTETTDRDARTLHRLLEFDPMAREFRRDGDNPLEGDLFVLDEVSMVDVRLADAFLRAVPTGSVVILVGDVDQLPSVGPGSVLKDLIASPLVPVVRLTEIFRQDSRSRIVIAAHAINRGEAPPLEAPGDDLSDFYFVEVGEPEAVRRMIVHLVTRRIPERFGFDPMTEIQVLTPMNRTTLGRHSLNETLQTALNPGPAPEVTRFGVTLRVGDRVLQTVNDYDRAVFNGDLGRITAIDEEQQDVVAEFEGSPVRYDFGSLDELTLAYALSIHKSQGSEYPAVVIPVHTQHFVMLRRNLLYTGLTRGKRLVVLVGSRYALELAIERDDTDTRFTALGERLRNG